MGPHVCVGAKVLDCSCEMMLIEYVIDVFASPGY